MTKIYFTNPTV